MIDILYGLLIGIGVGLLVVVGIVVALDRTMKDKHGNR